MYFSTIYLCAFLVANRFLITISHLATRADDSSTVDVSVGVVCHTKFIALTIDFNMCQEHTVSMHYLLYLFTSTPSFLCPFQPFG